MIERCYRCGRSEDEVKLVDVVYGNEIVKMCEECVVVEDVVVLRRPSTFHLKERKEGESVYERLRKISEIDKEKEKQEKEINEVLYNNRINEKSLEDELKKAKKRNIPLKLVDNFHWLIVMARRRRKLSKKQVAEAIGESENVIDMVEKAILPDDAYILIGKLEQFFGIKLRKDYDDSDTDYGIEKVELDGEEGRKKPSVILKIDRKAINTLTISDLIEMKKRKEEIENAKKEENISENINKYREQGEQKSEDLSDDEIRDMIWQRHQHRKARGVSEKKKEEEVKEKEEKELSAEELIGDKVGKEKEPQGSKIKNKSVKNFKKFFKKLKERFKKRKKLTKQDIQKVLDDERNLIRRKNEN